MHVMKRLESSYGWKFCGFVITGNLNDTWTSCATLLKWYVNIVHFAACAWQVVRSCRHEDCQHFNSLPTMPLHVAAAQCSVTGEGATAWLSSYQTRPGHPAVSDSLLRTFPKHSKIKFVPKSPCPKATAPCRAYVHGESLKQGCRRQRAKRSCAVKLSDVRAQPTQRDGFYFCWVGVCLVWLGCVGCWLCCAQNREPAFSVWFEDLGSELV